MLSFPINGLIGVEITIINMYRTRDSIQLWSSRLNLIRLMSKVKRKNFRNLLVRNPQNQFHPKAMKQRAKAVMLKRPSSLSSIM